MQATLGPLAEAVEARLAAWRREQAVTRLWAKDPTLWFAEPTPELEDRLGWLDLPRAMRPQVDDFRSFGEEIAAEGIERVLLLGMGGSSLAPEVFQRTFGNAAGFPSLTVVDSTHPDAIRRLDAAVDPGHTLFVVASKSGTTLETLSFFRHFWEHAAGSPAPGRRFVAITDPGSPLEGLARERGFRRIFLAPADVGGRFSALSPFGLLPAALIGHDPGRLLDAAARVADASRTADAEAVALGAILGEGARAGHDKLTFLASPHLAATPDWIEQLIAESTGKDGRGIVPIAGEPATAAEVYGDDRLFVQLKLAGEDDRPSERLLDALAAAGQPVVRLVLDEPFDLGGEVLRWEIATALAGAVLGIHPFNQPDVQLAKELARRAMAGDTAAPSPPGLPVDDDALQEVFSAWLQAAGRRDYLCVQAFLAPGEEVLRGLARLRHKLAATTRLATSVGYGPRFLHSTGQLHKGGPNSGLFLQLIDTPADDLPVPGAGHTFGQLIRAQADGDLAALTQRRRRALRVDLGRDAAAGLAKLVERF